MGIKRENLSWADLYSKIVGLIEKGAKVIHMTTILQSSDITHLVYAFLIFVAQSPKDYTSDHHIFR